MNKRVSTMLGIAIASAVLVASAGPAHASLKCKQTLLKQSSKLTQAIAKILEKCDEGVQKGNVTGPCPDAAKAQPAITNAKSKLKAAIVKDCTGSTGEFPFGRCPNEVTSGPGVCTNILIQNEGNIGDCLNCLADHNATELEAVLYGSLLPPGTNKSIATCQLKVGKSTTAFYIAKSKAMANCQAAILKGKSPGPCPDAATTAAITKAESTKVAAITKACCGPDGHCGGATCYESKTPVCISGSNAGTACTAGSECPGGICSTTSVICSGGANDGGNCSVDSECPGGSCISTSVGDACEAASDCGRCRGGTTPGDGCRSNGECHSNPGACDTGINACVGGSNDGNPCQLKCKGGANNGTICTAGSECPGGACNGAIDCPSIGGGTCIGVTGFCVGSDDLRPIQDLGYPDPCPGLTASGAPIELMGQTGVGLLACVDPLADDRADCQVAASAPFFNGGLIPPICIDAVPECTPGAGTSTVTVSIVLAPAVTDIAGISISLGYENSLVLLPGHGEVAFPGPITNIQGGNVQAEDRDDALIYSDANLGGLSAGPLFSVQFTTCNGASAPTINDFGCVVRSASDSAGHDISDGVSCAVTAIN